MLTAAYSGGLIQYRGCWCPPGVLRSWAVMVLTIWYTLIHYSDVIMGAMAYQITSLTIVYWTIYSGADRRKHQSSAVLALSAGNSPVTGEFPTQRASNAESVSIWWRHHDMHWFLLSTRKDFNCLCTQSVGKWRNMNIFCVSSKQFST